MSLPSKANKGLKGDFSRLSYLSSVLFTLLTLNTEHSGTIGFQHGPHLRVEFFVAPAPCRSVLGVSLRLS